MNLLLNALLLFAPAGIANMAPVLANKIPGLRTWNIPMDFGKSYHGKRIFGDHKTWRGLTTGVLAGTLASYGIYQLETFGLSLGTFMLFGATTSAGALLGDAIKSFFKRRAHVPSGKSWFPFDQTDYIVGGLLFALPFSVLTLPLAATIFIMYFVLHLLTAYLGYLLKLKSDPI